MITSMDTIVTRCLYSRTNLVSLLCTCRQGLLVVETPVARLGTRATGKGHYLVSPNEFSPDLRGLESEANSSLMTFAPSQINSLVSQNQTK